MNAKPERDLNKPNHSQSLSRAALGVTELFFLLGLILLASGVWVLFGWPYVLIALGVSLIVTANVMQFGE